MRSSDWSSDVCSSDLVGGHLVVVGLHLGDGARDLGLVTVQVVVTQGEDGLIDNLALFVGEFAAIGGDVAGVEDQHAAGADPLPHRRLERAVALVGELALAASFDLAVHGLRSEEHTSELQSLMRISYAVFCLKKKKKT